MSNSRHIGTDKRVAKRRAGRSGLGIHYQLLVAAYIAAVVLFSYQEEFTQAAKVIGAMLGLAFVYLVAAKRKEVAFPATFRVWLVWFAVALVSCALSEDIALAVQRAATFAQVSMVGFVVTNLLIWNRSTQFYSMSLILAALVSCVVVSGAPGAFSEADGRLYGTMGNANVYGVMLSVALVLAMITAVDARNWITKVFFFGVAVPVGAMLLQTGSRKAMIAGLILGGGLITLSHLYKASATSLRAVVSAVLVAGALMIIGIAALVRSEFWFRTERALAVIGGDFSEADTSVVDRIWLARKAIELFVQNPVIGVGLDAFRGVSGSSLISAIGTYSHSNYLEILVSTGIIGFVVFFSAYGIWLTRLYTLRRHLRSPVLFRRYTTVLVVVMMLVSMDVAMVSYYEKVTWLVIPMVVAELHLLGTADSRQIGYGRTFRRYSGVK